MSYEPVLTDDGLKIRDENGTVVWGPSESYSWPPNHEMMEAVIQNTSISEPTKSLLQLIVGNVEITDDQR